MTGAFSNMKYHLIDEDLTQPLYQIDRNAHIGQIMEVLLDLIDPGAATAENLQKVGKDLLR